MLNKFICAFTASILLTTPVLADNFAFAVPGEPGLQLSISGYDAAGSPMFFSRSDQVETYMGAPHYIVRVDEVIFANKTLARWCVVGLAGRNVELCDTNPHETRGTYLFAATTPEPEQPDEPETADSTLACAAAALQAAGYLAPGQDIDPAEAIRRAALRFAAVQKDDPKLPELGDDTLEQWCDRFAAVEKAGITPLPPLLGELNFGPDVSVPLARETAAALLQADRVLDIVVGYRLKEPPAIYISADAGWMTDGYAERTPLQPGERQQREAQFAACNGGEANFRVMFMCTESKVFSEDWFGVGARTQHAFALVHELFHVVQNELIGPAAGGCCNETQSLSRIGPTWLVEGGAEYVAFHLLAASGWKNLGKEMQHQAAEAEKSGLTASDVELRGAYYANGDASFVGLAATYELLGTTGPQALPRFWAALGKGNDWQTAFEAAFGITAQSFYEAGDRRVADAVSPGEMVQCLQGALNHLGFDAGPVDGDLGRGTRAALEAYAAKHASVFARYQLDSDERAGPVCLYLARQHGLDDASGGIAERLGRQATFALAFGADPEAVGSMAVRDYGGNTLTETDVLATIKRASDGAMIRSVRLPYLLAKDGVEACMRTADGWIIKGNDGKNYKASCDRIDPVFGTRGIVIDYRIERGEPG